METLKREPAPAAVESYFAQASPRFRPLLLRLRRAVREAAPDAEERISYGMVALRLNGPLVYYGAFRDHLSLFVGSPTVRKQFAKELQPFAAGKGTVLFTPEHPLPLPLVRRIVRARAAENRARKPARSR